MRTLTKPHIFVDNEPTNWDEDMSIFKRNMDFVLCHDGMDSDCMTQILEWAENPNINSTKYAFFDWDHTISVVDGMNYDLILQRPDEITFEFQRIMGGFERVRQLQQLFSKLLSFSKVYILTHNPRASKKTETRPIYLHMLMELMPTISRKMADSMLYYSGDYGDKKHNSATRILKLTKSRKTKSQKAGKKIRRILTPFYVPNSKSAERSTRRRRTQ